MRELPDELYNEIISHLQYSLCDPWRARESGRRAEPGLEAFENLHHLAHILPTNNSTTPRKSSDSTDTLSRHASPPTCPDIPSLLNLRLTSRAFNRAASPLLFKLVKTVFRPVDRQPVESSKLVWLPPITYSPSVTVEQWRNNSRQHIQLPPIDFSGPAAVSQLRNISRQHIQLPPIDYSGPATVSQLPPVGLSGSSHNGPFAASDRNTMRGRYYPNLQESIITSILAPDSSLATLIKKQSVNFTNTGDHDITSAGPFFGTSSIDDAIHKSTQLMIHNLPSLVKRLPGLESFELLVDYWQCDYGGLDEGTVPQLNLDLLDDLTQSLCQSLSTSSLEHLTDLRLLLPCTHDFDELASVLSDSFLSRLQSLFLGVTDATGPGGSRTYLIWADYNEDGDEGFPPSNLQEKYPNKNFGKGIADILSRCHNLKSLGVSGTHILNGNYVEWLPRSTGLELVNLSRIKISANKLIELLSPSKTLTNNLSVLSKVWIEGIELTAGLWSDVLAHLEACPSLTYFNGEGLQYARDGESSGFRDYRGRAWEDFFDIYSVREEDNMALENVQKLLVERAGGPELYPQLGQEQSRAD